MVYLDKDARTFRARSLADGTSRTLVALQPNEFVSRFLISPDGRRIAYVLATRINADLADCVPDCEAGLITIDTGVRVPLPKLRGHQRLAAWSPDGRFLLCGTGQPMVVDTTTGDVWPLAQPGVGWDGEGSWAPDGSFVVITQAAEVTEWRQWRGVTSDVITAMTARGGRD